ncbi:MAG: rhodanese-like domain-containing protein [Rhodothermales bacterium]|nr:rhodanese-like domain-containing protein [Rhodothermales bacterium]
MAVPEITVSELAARISEDDDFLLLDVRPGFERDFSNIGGAHMQMSEIPARLAELEEYLDQDIVVYCRSGQRSFQVVHFLRSRGFSGAVNLKGGILAWSREIDPDIPQY